MPGATNASRLRQEARRVLLKTTGRFLQDSRPPPTLHLCWPCESIGLPPTLVGARLLCRPVCCGTHDSGEQGGLPGLGHQLRFQEGNPGDPQYLPLAWVPSRAVLCREAVRLRFPEIQANAFAAVNAPTDEAQSLGFAA